MGCCHYFAPTDGGSAAFTVEMPRYTFGRGTMREIGARLRMRGLTRVALVTDAYLAGTAPMETVRASMRAAGVEFAEYAEVRIEPNDSGVLDCARFVAEGRFDGVLAVGGGSVIDTAKGALVYATHPAPATDYFAPPAGAGRAVPGPLRPIVACPTTAGTGSEATGLSVIRIGSLDTKFVIASRHILPVEAVVDPTWMDTLPRTVVASSGFDLLSHAIETYTARAYTRWPAVEDPAARPMIQGANPWSDLHAREALRIVGAMLERGVADAADHEARDALIWAASLAGMAFGNCGTHLPHAFSYGVTHLLREFRIPADYPAGDGPFVPHGISVIVNSPSVFRFTARGAPERHLEAAACLGVTARDATPDDAGEVVAGRIVELMRATGMPNGLGALGFTAADAPALADSALRQRRAIGNAPRDTARDDAIAIFEGAVSYW
ncbi:MAG: iron-containing alcohol dehydrogenase [Ectothiorhodospiraceae bacterium]|nr:iron-containing alcohol dehydrogenase [Chromatiales bacterium]MCP5156451.1 iron-containing alcohol dehydrogenase [Ectothiorhodospiraceae bacterium]